MIIERIKDLIENHKITKLSTRFSLLDESRLEDTKTEERFYRVDKGNWVLSIGGDDPRVSFSDFLDKVYDIKINTKENNTKKEYLN